ncbi:major facilitator superfamily transporter [Acetobacter nitrogenifigens DSM 23921 = NBRC 105050]|uniref:MFS transporter n=1 Tax=Acetobacter nitrogenifigens DSM 23921 = NBRC 105050 TaxID=1120919 RepID=A0A511XD54_9PROT|nr:MFS transporter [Acetobacter nitrogenifigens]GBQ91636.1 major facilitator superfamily transporter [Acetobacter nitrogenifigens DSM 23921 = NBRC 105050]GEN60811.1 MFS transporter [Acetobacter nitrogenifigens DSM 23921 = NBRC 105050]
MTAVRTSTLSDSLGAGTLPTATLDALYRRIDLRVVTILAVSYLLDCIDRLNIGFAQHQISERIGLTPQDYGFAAGIFFIGYVLFEIPSNLLLPKVGARRTFFRIMVLWGLTSASMGLITNRNAFYVMRFLLGVFEAGFAPAAMYYLASWYPRERMATAISIQQIAAPMSGVIAGPVSGMLVQNMDHVAGVDGWRWMFFLEGLPSIIMGFVVFATLPDKPSEARWLTPAEARIVEENASSTGSSHHGFSAVLRDKMIYILSLGYFCVICGLYTISFWLPTVLRQSGATSDLQIGFLAAIPFFCGTVAILTWGRRSDRLQERRWHGAIPALLAAVGLASIVATTGSLVGAVIALSVTAMCLYSTYLVFLSVPSDLLKGPGAAGGYALINSIGLLGGFCSPIIIGHVTQITGNVNAGLLTMSGIVALGGLIFIFAIPGGRATPAGTMPPE